MAVAEWNQNCPPDSECALIFGVTQSWLSACSRFVQSELYIDRKVPASIGVVAARSGTRSLNSLYKSSIQPRRVSSWLQS
eukprot:COSAG06_NODE_61829_length_266_cov_1.239521_1_plen_79_part_10